MDAHADEPLRVMLDTMVFDAIVADDVTLEAYRQAVRERRIVPFTTPVQEAQLALAPDHKRSRFKRVPREVVPSSVAGGRTDGSLPTKAGHIADAIIGDTARVQGMVLVTDDRRLRERLAELEPPPTVWPVADLLRRIRAGGSGSRW